MPRQLPPISIIIPTFNEADFIVGCLNSIIQGSYPVEKIEIIVVDGGSNDDTVSKVKQLAKAPLNTKILYNTKKNTSAAINTGAKAAQHELLIWCGAHALYHQDYVLNSVTTLLDEPEAAMVGGIISPIAKTPTGKAIAIATSSKFGTGNPQYRHAAKRQQVDTVFSGCFFKKHLLKAGGLNEGWVHNQDYEFNHRLRHQAGPIILEPSIRCQYYCRETLPKLSKQYFNYGFWRLKTLFKHPSSFTYRQAAPGVLCISLMIAAAFIVAGYALAWAVPLLYFAACLTMATKLAFDNKQASLLVYLPMIFPTLHLSWGAGFLKSALLSSVKRCFGRKQW